MKKTIIFAGVMGVMLVHMANAEVTQNFPTDVTHPAFTAASNAAKPYAVREANIKLATTNYVDVRVNEANTDVQTLSTTANTDKVAVDANATAIDAMDDDRQVKPSTDSCDTTGAPAGTQYVACGYIAPEGGNATSSNESVQMNRENYSWVKIIAPAAANS